MSQFGRGQILKIDLGSEKVTREPIPGELAKKYLGGEGINSRLLWEHFLKVSPEIDPLSPDNVIIAGVGMLGATGYGGGTKMKWTFKSPQTGFFGDSSSGGTFGANLRWAGYDHLIVSGKASRPVYIFINNDDVQIKDAGNLWGKSTGDTDTLIKAELGLEDAETACIGQSGENLVRLSGLQVSRNRGASRTGAGCVFGSKNLKAIAVRGTKGIKIHDPARFLKAIQDMSATLNKNQKLRDVWKSAGTLGMFGYYNRLGLNQYRNNQNTIVPRDKFDKISGQWYNANMAVRGLTCSPGCVSGCTGLYKTKGTESPAAAEYAGESGHRFELAAQIGWGAACDIADAPALAHLWETCCGFGIDIIEISIATGFLMELWERGIINAQDTLNWYGEPVSLEWGNYHSALKVIESTALQKNEMGRIMKNGLYRAAERIGQLKGIDVLQYAIYGKGGSAFDSDVRNTPSWAVTTATASRGACHLKGSVATVERFQRSDVSMKEFGSDKAAEFCTPALKGKDGARGENRVALVNILGLCTFLTAMDSVNLPPEMFAEALTASTGVPVSGPELLIAGERTVNIEKAFNSRLGLTRKDDKLCARWMNEPLPDGPYKGVKAADYLEQVKDEYYEAHGWDKATSLQTRGKLEQLDMSDVAEVLEKESKLG